MTWLLDPDLWLTVFIVGGLVWAVADICRHNDKPKP